MPCLRFRRRRLAVWVRVQGPLTRHNVGYNGGPIPEGKAAGANATVRAVVDGNQVLPASVRHTDARFRASSSAKFATVDRTEG
jgi:hypothetical protein